MRGALSYSVLLTQPDTSARSPTASNWVYGRALHYGIHWLVRVRFAEGAAYTELLAAGPCNLASCRGTSHRQLAWSPLTASFCVLSDLATRHNPLVHNFLQCCVYFIAHLRYNAGAVWYFILTLFAALTVVSGQCPLSLLRPPACLSFFCGLSAWTSTRDVHVANAPHGHDASWDPGKKEGGGGGAHACRSAGGAAAPCHTHPHESPRAWCTVHFSNTLMAAARPHKGVPQGWADRPT